MFLFDNPAVEIWACLAMFKLKSPNLYFWPLYIACFAHISLGWVDQAAWFLVHEIVFVIKLLNFSDFLQSSCTPEIVLLSDQV